MDGVFITLLLFSLSLLLPHPSSSLPLCTDLRAPLIPKTPLTFCPYNGRVCCDSAQDLQLQKQFEAMNISDSGCGSVVKSILCAMCDQFSAQLFDVESGPRPVPVLCNSSVLANSSLSKTSDFCSSVWEKCQNVAIINSPFAPSLQGRGGVPQNSTSSKLTDLWQSKSDFCHAFGGASDDGSFCFDGEPVLLNNTGTPLPPKGLCLEKIGSGSLYLNMVPHPDGTNRAFFSDQPGKVWLATIPEQDSGESLGLDESTPFVDLTDEVHYDTSFGMMGMAFHPNFSQNGRFFASFNCDKVKNPKCTGRCSCNSDVNCDPSKLEPSSGVQPCQYHSVIAEFTANGTASEPSMAKSAKPLEVRRIFTIGLPSTSSHGGQIHFGPADGYLYIMNGDGGLKDDAYNFAQNKKSLLGKIMRVDVDNTLSAAEIGDLGLWGNYSIPKDNPYFEDKELQPEIWALGLRNPWRCSFDSERPSYFMCADTGQNRYEEVDIITKGGNYGWRIYEGPLLFDPKQAPGGNTSADSINPIFPVMGYNHSDINKNEGSAAISGGYFYRSMTDPCMYGSYLYGDLYANAIWAAAETPKNSGNFTTSTIPFGCARDSPIQCTFKPSSTLPALGYIYSFGQDNRKDVYILTSSGVYRVVRPSRCNYTCSKENVTAVANPAPPPASSFSQLTKPQKELMLFLSSLLLLVGFIL
ncbi:HIPL1 protein-like [Cornus florida]|uniref:HIPL1 protein-like n=1 Tax=Cornus florida TaxID=4283 RepID=UPI0028977FBC|nr:HIPL1 protein-like [Cornus florida]